MSTARNRPLVIYDQDCGFCVKWINKFKDITLSTIDFKGYKEVMDEFPDISLKDFQRSLKYVDESGKVTQAGEAACKLLKQTSSPLKFISFLYDTIPGAKYVIEAGYKVVANNRHFFSKVFS
ncbi:hypothetical protein DID80_01810 [Candidatus Marinamargulisbacteria bacterium SCGC AAA071-K20]|nr:hypothetical protein DID80_01810 [Candidatus Marinamargulisbacteria bacterium SCGC AAA071-K20]